MKVQNLEKPGLFKRIMFGENARKPTHRDYDPVKDLEKEQPNFNRYYIHSKLGIDFSIQLELQKSH